MTFGWLPHAAPYENAVHARLRSRCRGLPWRIAAIGKVQEVEAGTYSISVSRTTGIATDTNKTLSAAVDKAGEFCHAKGQKF